MPPTASDQIRLRERSLEAAKRFSWYPDLQTNASQPAFLTQEILDQHYYSAEPDPTHHAYFTSGSRTGKRRRIDYSRQDEERYLATKTSVFGNFVRTRAFKVRRVLSDVGTGHAANTANSIFARIGVEHESISFDRPLDEHMVVLDRMRPEILYTMPSILEGLLRCGPQAWWSGIRGVILVGESASEKWIENIITARLGVTAADVMDTYGSIEIGLIAYYSHPHGAYVVVDTVLAEGVSPVDIGLGQACASGESVLVVTSLIRDAFPAVRYVTYDVVRDFTPSVGSEPAKFRSIVRRFGHEFKHGEKISLHDIEAVVFGHVRDAVIRVRTEDRRLRIFISSDSLTEDLLGRLRDEIERSIPEIGIMVGSGLLDRVEVTAVPYEQLPEDRLRAKQRLVL